MIHPAASDEIATSWCVAFDGAGLDHEKCALLVEERTPGGFYGFWTYDPGTVDYIVDHLSSTYIPVDTDGSERFEESRTLEDERSESSRSERE